MRIRADKITFSFILKYFLFKSFRVFALKDLAIGKQYFFTNTLEFSAANNIYLSWLLFWQMKLELINLKKQTVNGLRTSRNKATPNSLDRCAQPADENSTNDN
jgi:hypothetical protein